MKQGIASGLKGDKVDQLERQLTGAITSAGESKTLDQNQIQSLVSLYQQGKLQEALTSGMALAERFPDDLNIHSVLGAVYLSLIHI